MEEAAEYVVEGRREESEDDAVIDAVPEVASTPVRDEEVASGEGATTGTGDGPEARAPKGDGPEAVGTIEGATGEATPEGEAQTPEPRPRARDAEAEKLRAEMEVLRAERDALRVREVESHRRFLLAENVGRVVPELVTGDSVEALESSLAVAKGAFEAVRAATIAELTEAQRVGASNGSREEAVDLEGMSPVQKIAYGLKRSNE